MQIVITGSGGRLGAALVRQLSAAHEVTGLDRAAIDLADPDSVERALSGLQFDVLINCAALTNLDYCEGHAGEARRVNAEAVGEMAGVAAARGARFFQISTDYVFNGEKQEPYGETDASDPLSVYGQTKLEGEECALAASPANLIARVSWVFGPDRPSFPDAILKRALAGESLEAVADKTSSPAYTLDLAEGISRLLETPGASGVFHLCNSGVCSWQEYGQEMIDLAVAAGLPVKSQRVEGIPLSSLTAFVAQRPLHTAMATTRYRELTGCEFRGWREALADYVKRFAGKA